jgi:hypothetical protein
MAEQNELIFSAALDTSKLQKGLGEGIGGPIDVPIDFDFTEALKGVQEMKKALASLDDVLTANVDEVTEFDAATKKAVENIRRAIPAADELAKALGKGDIKALKELDELERELQRVAESTKSTLSEATAAALSDPKVLKAVRRYGTILQGSLDGVAKVNEKLALANDPNETPAARRDAATSAKELQERLTVNQEKLGKLRTTIKAAFGEGAEEGKALIRTLNSIATEGRDVQDILVGIAKSLNNIPLNKAATGAISQLQEAKKLTGTAKPVYQNDLNKQVQTAVQQAVSQAVSQISTNPAQTLKGPDLGEGGLAAVNANISVDAATLVRNIRQSLSTVEGPVGEANVAADPEFLRKSIRTSLTDESSLFYAKVAINREYFLESIREALKAADDLKIQVKAKVDKKQAEQAEAATVQAPKEKKAPKAPDPEKTLEGRARTRQLRMEAVANPVDVVKKLNANLAESLQEVFSAKGSNARDVLKKALESKDSILTTLNSAVQNTSLSKDLREQVDAIARSIESQIFRPIQTELSRLESEVIRGIAEGQSASKRKRQAEEREAARKRREEEEKDKPPTFRTKAGDRQLGLQAAQDPLGTARQLGDKDLVTRVFKVLSAKGTGDTSRLTGALGQRDDILSQLNSAALNEGLSRDLRVKADALAKQLDKALFDPVKDELKQIAKRKAAEDANLQREFRKLEIEENRQNRETLSKARKAEREAEKAADAAANQARQAARRKALNIMEGPNAASQVRMYAPNAANDFKLLQNAMATVGSRDINVKTGDRLKALEVGRAAALRFNEEIERLLASTTSEIRQAALKAIQQKAGSKFITPLRNNKKVEREVDAEIVWRQIADQMTKEINTFSAARSNFSGINTEPEALGRQALKDYQSQVLNFEKMQARFALARTTKEKDDQLKLLDLARQKLRVAEEELKLRVLEGNKQKNVTTRLFDLGSGNNASLGTSETVPRGAAFFNLTEGLTRAFSSEFDTLSKKFNDLGKQDFLRKLFNPAGAKEVAKEFLRIRGVGEDILSDNQKLTAELEKHIGPLREAFKLQDKLTDEINAGVAALAREEKQRRNIKSSMAGFANVLRNSAALFGGFSLGFTAVNEIRNSVREYAQFEQEISGIQGVLSGRDAGAAQRLSGGVQQAAVKYGQNLVEAAKAARLFAQAGLDANETIKQLNIAFAAQKAIGLPLEQVQELQLAVRAVTESNDRFNQSLNYTSLILEKISAVESTFAVSGQDLADGLKILSPILEQFAGDVAGTADVFDVTNALITTAVQRLRISGTQAANALKFILSRLVRPEIGKQLQEQFQFNLGDETGKNLLPLDQLIPALSKRYREILKESGTAKASQFANVISGGRQSNVLLAILQEQDQYFTALNRSADAYSGIEERAAIATDTLATSVGRLNASFDAFIVNLAETSGIGQGTVLILNRLADAFSALADGGRSGGVLGTLAAITSIGAVVQLVKRAYLGLTAAAAGVTASQTAVAGSSAGVAAGMTATSVTSRLATVGLTAATGAARGFVGVAGTMARFLGPVATIVFALTAAVGALGVAFGETDKKVDRSKIKLKSLEELKVGESPAQQRLNERTLAANAQPDQFNVGLGSQSEVSGLLDRLTRNSEFQKALSEIPKELRSFDQASQQAFAKYGRDNPEVMRKFADSVVKIFRNELPESARASFDAIKTQAQKVGTIQEIIGSAATIANLQIADSIDQIRIRTQEMIDEANKGLAKIQKQSKFTQFFLTGGTLDMVVGSSSSKPVETQARDIVGVLKRGFEDTDLGQLVASSGFKALLQDIIQVARNEGRDLRADAVVSTALGASTIDPRTQQIVRALNDVEFAVTQSDKDGVPLATGSRLTEIATTNLLRGTERQAISQVANDSTRVSSFGQALEKASKSLQLSLADSKALEFADETGKAVNGLRQFRDALLNEVLAAFQDISRFRADEKISKDFGLGFNQADQQAGLGRGLLGRAAQFENNQLAEIIKQQRLLQELESQRGKVKGKSAIESQELQIKSQRDAFRENLSDFANTAIDDILPTNSPEAVEVISQLKRELEATGDEALTLKRFLETLGSILLRNANALRSANGESLQNYELAAEKLQKEQEIQQAMLPINATLAQKQALRVKSAADTVALQLKQLEVTRNATGQDTVSYELAKRKLLLQYEINQAKTAELELASAERALSEQTRTNLMSMTSGITQLFTDTSIWEQLFADDDPETRWKSRMQALGKITLNTLSPVFKTVSDRLAQALQEKLVDKLLNIGDLAEFAQLGELRLKQDVESAAKFASTVGTTFDVGSQLTADRLLQACVEGSSYIAGAVDPSARFVPPDFVSPPAPTETPESKATTEATKKAATAAAESATKSSSKLIGRSIGIFGGQILGTLAGKGGQGAQQGSNIGSTAGTLLAGGLGKIGALSFLGGPAGLALGGLAGGLLGGIFGGKSDKRDKSEDDQPLIKGLEAIERKQAETIQTIQSQTDALLKPENRLLNLPSTFNVPNYTPNFGSGGGGGGGTTITDNRRIEIRIDGGDLNAVRRVVEETIESSMGSVLNRQRRGQSWN